MNTRTLVTAALALAAALSLTACNGDNQTVLDDAQHEAKAVVTVKSLISQRLDELAGATAALQAAAPDGDADGWNATDDAAALSAMKDEWKKARRAYEGIEGAIAVIFPALDVSTDARYDFFLERAPDDDLFDDQGVTGMHAIERILWADAIPDSVVEFESALPGYSPAAFPSNQKEASAFKNALCARLVADTLSMHDKFEGLALDAPAAFQGVIGSMGEQLEKIEKAATGEEESRYARFTLADMRANVAAGEAFYGAFHAWMITKEKGVPVDDQIAVAFERLQAGYAALEGDALPDLPPGWSSEAPSATDLATPFGELFNIVRHESDPDVDGTLVHSMEESAALLGLE